MDKTSSTKTTGEKQTSDWKGVNPYSLAYFTHLEMTGPRDVLNWCINIGLIPARYECPKCDNFMELSERKNTVDGFEWRCRKRGNKNPHDITRSVRKGTFIYGCKLAICDILRIIRLWFGRCMQAFVTEEVKVSSHVVIDWFRFCREVCMVDVMNESVCIGGEDCIIEVVECALGKVTNGNEKYFSCGWVIGGIEKGTNRCFIRALNNRNKEELLSVISEWVLPGSTVISDCWNVYDCLEDEHFIELCLANKLTFKTPSHSKSENKSAIEPVWSAVRRFLRNTTTHIDVEMDSYLGEYLWRKKYRYSMSDDVFKAFLLAIVNMHNPPGRDISTEVLDNLGNTSFPDCDNVMES